jgi:hypothetical protein
MRGMVGALPKLERRMENWVPDMVHQKFGFTVMLLVTGVTEMRLVLTAVHRRRH